MSWISKISPSIRYFLKSCLSFLAVLIILFALLISSARLFIPLLNDHRAWFENWATELFQRPVKIKEVDVAFRAWHIVFNFRQVEVMSKRKKREAIHANQLNVGIDLLSSLWHWQLVTSYIGLSGIDLKVVDSKKKGFKINGFLLSDPAAQEKPFSFSQDVLPFLMWLQVQNRIELQDLHLHWRSVAGQGMNIPNLNLTLVNEGGHYQFRGLGNIDGDANKRVQILFDVQGSAEKLASLNGRGYFFIEGLSIGKWLRYYSWGGVKIEKVHVGIELWATITQGVISSLQAKLQLKNALIQTKSHKRINLNALLGEVNWQKENKTNWQLDVNKLNLVLNDEPLAPLQFSVKSQQKSKGVPYQSLLIKSLAIQTITPLLPFVDPLPQSFKKTWQHLALQGTVSDLQLMHEGSLWPEATQCQDFRIKSDSKLLPPSIMPLLKIKVPCEKRQVSKERNFFIKAQFKNLHWYAWKDIPGVNNLSGALALTPTRARLTLSSQDGSILAHQLFGQALHFQSLRGDFFISDQNGLKLQAHDLWWKSRAISLLANGNVKFNKQNKNPRINSIVLVNQPNTEYLQEVLPYRLFNKNLSTWLKHAFLSGQGLQGIVVLRGPLEQFPFPNHQGQFIADAQLKDIGLHYADEWPAIEHLSADLIFENQMMLVKAHKADLIGIPLNKLSAIIPDLESDDATLDVRATLNPDAQKVLHFISHSPLKKNLSGLSKLKIQGKTKGYIQLNVPLDDDKKDVQVKGGVRFDNNELQIPAYQLKFHQLSGELTFTDDVVDGAFQGSFLGYPAKLKLQTKYNKSHKKMMQSVLINSRLDIKTIRERFQFPLFKFLKGSMPYQANLSFYSNKTRLNLKSDMQGVLVDWPQPYKKSEKEKRSVDLIASFNSSGTNLQINYDKKIDAQLLFKSDSHDKDYLERAQVVFGGAKASLPSQPQLLINGFLPKLNWADWQPYLNVFQEDADKKSSRSIKKAEVQGPTLWPIVNINTGVFEILNRSLHATNLKASHQYQAWKINVAQAGVSGLISVPDNFPKQPLQVNLEQLHWNSQKLGKSKAKKEKIKWLPNDVPPLNLTIKQFYYDERLIGAIALDLKPVGKSLSIEKIKVNSKDGMLDAKGYWQQLKNHQKTHLSGTMQFKNLGDFLNAWDVTEHLKSGEGKVNLDLTWPSSPDDIVTKGLNGSAYLDLSNGQIVNLGKDADAKIGLGKLVNILSIQSLLRLGDLAKDGYSYDSFKGHYQFVDGNVNTKDTVIDGPVAKLVIKGRLGLPARDYDLLIAVRPYLTASVPIVATIIGGPIAGAAAFVANKLISPELGKIVGQRYHLQGSWDNPKLLPLTELKPVKKQTKAPVVSEKASSRKLDN